MDEAVKQIIDDYNAVVKDVDSEAHNRNDNRAFGGVIRSIKGKLQEHITNEIIKIAWNRLGGKESRLEINSKKIKIPIVKPYIEKIENENIKNHILENVSNTKHMEICTIIEM